MNDAQFARFEPKVEKVPNGCWNWTGAITKQGYGNFTSDARRKHYKFKVAHRMAYEHWVGPIPEGKQLDHLCRNRRCVNPEHLDPVTNRENTQRGLRGRLVTHCNKGHEYTTENTHIRPDGRRKCRVCMEESLRLYMTKKKAAGA